MVPYGAWYKGEIQNTLTEWMEPCGALRWTYKGLQGAHPEELAFPMGLG